MNQPTLTPSEAALVRDLLKVWDESWASGPCDSQCMCARCRAVDAAGTHEAATFDSLAAKVGGDK